MHRGAWWMLIFLSSSLALVAGCETKEPRIISQHGDRSTSGKESSSDALDPKPAQMPAINIDGDVTSSSEISDSPRPEKATPAAAEPAGPQKQDPATDAGTVDGTVPTPSTPPPPAAATYAWTYAEFGAVPAQAVSAGTAFGQTAFFCRARYNGGTFAGYLLENYFCYVPYLATVVFAEYYEVLTSTAEYVQQHFTLVASTYGNSVANALVIGRDPNGGDLYQCSITLPNGQVRLGIVHSDFSSCLFVDADGVYYVDSYYLVTHK